jgi:hypothetical protein
MAKKKAEPEPTTEAPPFEPYKATAALPGHGNVEGEVLLDRGNEHEFQLLFAFGGGGMNHRHWIKRDWVA